MSDGDKVSADQINYWFPVSKLIQYKEGICMVERTSRVPQGTQPARGERGDIRYLTSRARSHLAFLVAASNIEYRSIITLTYGEHWPRDGDIFKAHLNTMLTWLRLSKPKFSYVWVLEYQRRGAPHYHILTTLDAPTKEHERRQFSHKWRTIVDPELWWQGARYWKDSVRQARKYVYKVHRHPKAWEPLRDKDGAMKYITKYCLKMKQKEVPNDIVHVGRFYGMSRDVKRSITARAEIELDEEQLRLILRSFDHKTGEWDILPKYIFGLTIHLDEMDDCD